MAFMESSRYRTGSSTMVEMTVFFYNNLFYAYKGSKALIMKIYI